MRRALTDEPRQPDWRRPSRYRSARRSQALGRHHEPVGPGSADGGKESRSRHRQSRLPLPQPDSSAHKSCVAARRAGTLTLPLGTATQGERRKPLGDGLRQTCRAGPLARWERFASVAIPFVAVDARPTRLGRGSRRRRGGGRGVQPRYARGSLQLALRDFLVDERPIDGFGPILGGRAVPRRRAIAL